MAVHEIELADLRRLARGESPDLADAIVAFLDQYEDAPDEPPPEGTLTQHDLATQLREAGTRRDRTQRGVAKREAWGRFLGQPAAVLPQKVFLADLLVEIYESGTEAGRAAIIDVARRATPTLGLWGGLKRIYKLAESRHDAAVFGVLACMFDGGFGRNRGEVGPGTMIYMRRRAWRFLRQLGASVPELYPQFAAEVLRHYGRHARLQSSWVANHIWQHRSKHYTSTAFSGRVPADLVKHRAFDEAWKRSADPLMYLLESCEAEDPARFAIQSLRKDFPEKLRSVGVEWLARLARRPLGAVHEFLVETLQGSPEFHQGKLRGLGLHETVLGLLKSPSDKARAYAIEYARAHAQDMDVELLVALLDENGDDYQQDAAKFAASVLQGRKPRDLGYALLGRLLAFDTTAKWANKALEESFDRKELPESFLVDMIFAGEPQREWATGYLAKKYRPGEIGADFWKRVLDDPRQRKEDNYERWEIAQTATAALGKLPLASLGVGWLLDSLTRDDIGSTVAGWIRKADSLPGLDVERVKGLVFNPDYRPVALEVLGNPKLVKPRDLTLPWLLALARRPDPSLHEFAHRYLLQHMSPADFSDGDDREAGIARLFALATGEKEPEAVRAFAQTYLRCHHPVIGPEQPESKSFSLKPQLARSAYKPERVWPALWDLRPDVRKFAVAITRAELRAWGYLPRVYELAESEAKEVRNIAYDALLKAGTGAGDKAETFELDEIEPAKVFAMTESRRRPTREVGMEIIRRHYARLGAAERLGWLMESPDREVRLFAVRLLWEKHRPRALPPGWKPRGKSAVALGEDAGRFADVAALRDFLRRILFGVPPGRSMDPRDDDGPRRHIAASVAKRNVIDVVRDLGLEDAAFARLVAPVLQEFTGSLAKGEWQACLAALMHLRAAHPGVELSGAN